MLGQPEYATANNYGGYGSISAYQSGSTSTPLGMTTLANSINPYTSSSNGYSKVLSIGNGAMTTVPTCYPYSDKNGSKDRLVFLSICCTFWAVSIVSSMGFQPVTFHCSHCKIMLRRMKFHVRISVSMAFSLVANFNSDKEKAFVLVAWWFCRHHKPTDFTSIVHAPHLIVAERKRTSEM